MSEKLQVHIINADQHGIDLELCAGDERFMLDSDYWIYDPLWQLVEALLVVLRDDESIHLVRWLIGSPECDFVFRNQAEQTRLEVILYPDHQRGVSRGNVVFTYENTRLNVVLPFWRALRALDSQTLPEKLRQALPEKELNLLTTRINTLRKNSADEEK